MRLIFWLLNQQKQFAEFLLVVLVWKITSAVDSIKLKACALCNMILKNWLAVIIPNVGRCLEKLEM
tara:strand:+ start:402 stop:599 length:198 start_codon:yes stop_codon:yes gene_type:complete